MKASSGELGSVYGMRVSLQGTAGGGFYPNAVTVWEVGGPWGPREHRAPSSASPADRRALPALHHPQAVPPPGSGLHFPAASAGGGGGAGRRRRPGERRRGRCAPGTRAGDHGVRRAGASTLTPGGGGGDEGASCERAGPA